MSDHADASRSVTLRKLALKNFRCWKEAEILFSPGINILHGANAQGKTSLLEALHLLALGKSFRSNKIDEIIRKESDLLRLQLTFSEHSVEETISFATDRKEKRITLGGAHYPSLAALVGMIPVVLITPDDNLIKAAPAERRRFLDLLLLQQNPLHYYHLARYNKALKQRNQLLRSKQETTAKAWEAQLALSGSYIAAARAKLTQEITPLIHEYCQEISATDALVTLSYNTKAKSAHEYEALYCKERKKEMRLGSTLVGPHRDLLQIQQKESDAKTVMSEGQSRSFTFAMKLAGWKYLKHKAGKAPTLLIDDFGLSLDSARREALLKILDEAEQLFITSTSSLEEVPFKGPCNRILIEAARDS